MVSQLCRIVSVLAIVVGLFGVAAFNALQLHAAQLPTETLQPTSTFGGPTVYAPDQVNIRSGPGTNYDQVGVMVAGQSAPAIGRSLAGEWVQIEYPGGPGGKAWVYALLISLRETSIEALSVVDAPPTATLPPTPTIPPGTGAPGTLEPTRLPTFTAIAPILQPTFQTPELEGGGFPPALLIVGLFMIGVFAGIMVVLRQRG
ncbi:MAG TPA: SH3 domain-containing protein [Anaerolineales bacterium]|nr:SH3 domain-containing protein [Anaerolineales bacterium]